MTAEIQAGEEGPVDRADSAARVEDKAVSAVLVARADLGGQTVRKDLPRV